MKQRISIALLLFAALGGLAWQLFLKPLSPGDKKAQDAVHGAAKSENLAALAVKTIDLTQGEHGVELWRLKAEWGNMRQEGGIVELEKPRFTYYMPPDNEEVSVSADSGDINQSSKLILFRNNVQARHSEDTIRGPLMVYNGTSKALTFPEGAVFEGPGMSGNAPRASWLLDKQLISAEGGVSMTWERDNHSPGGKAASKTAPDAAGKGDGSAAFSGGQTPDAPDSGPAVEPARTPEPEKSPGARKEPAKNAPAAP